MILPADPYLIAALQAAQQRAAGGVNVTGISGGSYVPSNSGTAVAITPPAAQVDVSGIIAQQAGGIQRGIAMDKQLHDYMAKNNMDYANQRQKIQAMKNLGFVPQDWEPSSEPPGMVHTAQGIFRPEDLPEDIRRASTQASQGRSGYYYSKPYEIQGNWYVIDYRTGEQVNWDLSKSKRLVAGAAPAGSGGPGNPAGEFKPDFTKDVPYDGAPDDYIKQVLEGFVPTPDHPVPPFTGKLVDSENGIYLDENGRRVQLNTQEQADLFVNGINARAQYKSNVLLDKVIQEQKAKGVATSQAEKQTALDALSKYRTEGNSYRIAEFLNDGGDVRVLVAAGFDDNQIDQVLADMQNAYTRNQKVAYAEYALQDVKTDSGYDLEKLFRINPDAERIAKNAGFKPEDIQSAKLKAESVEPVPYSEFRAQFFGDRGLSLEGYDKDAKGLPVPVPGPASGLTNEKRARMEEVEQQAYNEYTRKYGVASYVRSEAGEVAAALTVPAVKAMEPGGFKNVSGEDWAWTAGIIALTIATMGAAKGVSSIKFHISDIKVSAAKAGAAKRSMDLAISKLNKTPFDSPSYLKAAAKANKAMLDLEKLEAQNTPKNSPAYLEAAARAKKAIADLDKTAYSKASAQAQKAIEASRAADKEFLDKLNKIGTEEPAITKGSSKGKPVQNVEDRIKQAHGAPPEEGVKTRPTMMEPDVQIVDLPKLRRPTPSSLSTKQLADLEKSSRITGLKRSILDVNATRTKLTKAWDKLDEAKFGTPEYSRQLQEIASARAKFDGAMNNLNARFAPRTPGYTPSGYDSPLQSIEKRISSAQNNMKEIENKLHDTFKETYKAETDANGKTNLVRNKFVSSERRELEGQWEEARNNLNSLEVEKKALLDARSRGIPAPAVESYIMKWKKGGEKPGDLFKDLENYLKTDRDVKGNRPLKSPRKDRGGVAVKEKVEPETETKPKITEEGQQSTMKLEPEYEKAKGEPKPETGAPKVKENALTDKSGIPLAKPNRTPREISQHDIEEAIGRPLEGNELSPVSKSAIMTITERSIKQFNEWQPANRIELMPGTKTKADNKTKLQNLVKGQIETISDTNIKDQIRPLEDTIVKAVQKVQLKTATKTRTRTITRELEENETKLKIKPKLPDSVEKGPQEKASKAIKPGSLVWQQGALEVDPQRPGPEKEYKYAEPPNYEVETTFEKPDGYRETGRTPQETIQTIGGPVERKIDLDLGATTAHADPDQKKINFSKNKISYQKGNVKIIESTSRERTRPSKPVIRRVGKGQPRGRDLGAGVVRDRRSQHIKLI